MFSSKQNQNNQNPGYTTTTVTSTQAPVQTTFSNYQPAPSFGVHHSGSIIPNSAHCNNLFSPPHLHVDVHHTQHCDPHHGHHEPHHVHHYDPHHHGHNHGHHF